MSSENGGQTTISVEPARLIAFVSRSPELCAAHDRAGWVGLFASDGQVNDPVGSQPHNGRAAIERFYDTFIAPNALSFNVQNDVVCGMWVMRDLSIRSVMATGLMLDVPMHLRYQLVEENGLKVRRIYAHWELPVMMRQVLRGGWNGLRTSLELTPRLLKHQGWRGLLGFMRGYFGIGRRGKRTLESLLAALAHGNEAAARALLEPNCALEAPAGTAVTLPELLERLRGAESRKFIGAGNFASASVKLGPAQGVALCRFDHDPRHISGLQLFVQ